MKIIENHPLSEFLWYKIGGKARYFVEVSSPTDMPELLTFLKGKQPAQVFICGLGSNLVFQDEDYAGVVIAIAEPHDKKPLEVTDNGRLTVFAGDTLDTAIQFAFENELVGLEWAGGLPGTVGAGVRGNVGCFGGEIKDVLSSAEVISLSEPERGIQILSNEELAFSYRHSYVKEQKNMLVISATFQLAHATREVLHEAQEIYQKNRAYRATNHPLDYPNCGSVFKNIKSHDQVERILSVWPAISEQVNGKWHGKVSMGYIIRELGLSGYTVGQAQVSAKHCNFIINLGGARAADVRAVIEEIQRRCEETFGFRPEVEVEIVR